MMARIAALAAAAVLASVALPVAAQDLPEGAHDYGFAGLMARNNRADLAPLTSFILPSGSAAVAALHLARTVIRRAERATVALNEAEALNPHLLSYINRLSDHLFVAARKVAAGEGGDVLWQPGATRT